MTAQRFTGKVAIVTGGAGGIGAAIARRLSDEGASVLVADIAAPGPETPDCVYRQVDMRDAAQVGAMVDATLAQFGRLDVLINNAGIGHLAETPDMADADWDRLFAINVTAVFYACRAAIPVMRASGASGRGGAAIVNVASISGLAGDYGMGAYNASKGAVINYTRSLALDCARDGIRVNALCPGAIAGTAMQVGEVRGGQGGGDEYRQAWLGTIPLRRFGTAEEMANVAVFLASDEASYVTGAIIAADGGATAHTGQLDFPGRRRKREAANLPETKA